jgi:hypothetical protein
MRARRPGIVALVVAVAAVHLALLPRLLPAQLGDGAAADGRPQRLAVNFVATLQPAEPPPARTRALQRRLAPAAAAVPALPASASGADAAEANPFAEWAAPTPLEPAPLPPVLAEVPGPTAPAADAHALPDATAFDWPPSTRLSYRVVGDVRGPVEGHAQVEWLRQGLRYQVHLELSVALLASRRVSSDGIITPAGLAPRRYDEETRVVLREPRRVAVELAPDTLTLADGRVLPRPEGVQDSASQFVQMTWLFNARPELLQPGQSVAFPLALPRRLEPWVYDIVGPTTVSTPAGELAAVHVRPRREAGRGDLTAELWVAPSLQNLPVRLLIRQGPMTLDLLLERLPEQAAPGR